MKTHHLRAPLIGMQADSRNVSLRPLEDSHLKVSLRTMDASIKGLDPEATPPPNKCTATCLAIQRVAK